MKKQLFLVFLFLTSLIYSQDCKPSIVSKQTNGEIVNLYGGKVRDGGFGSNDKSVYSLYIAQVDNGKKGTSILVTLYEPVETKKDYNNAVNNFLNENNLKNSVLELELNGEKIKIPATECKQKPTKLLGSIVAYTVTFVGDLFKSDIEKLQKYDLQRFRLTIGGRPYERYFKKPTKRTAKLKKAFNCVEMEHIFEIKKKDASEMDLTEVSKSDYSSSINGKWSLQGEKGKVVEFKDGKVSYSKMGVKQYEGSYKIIGNRIIITTDYGNSIAEISMFLKDMLILKEKGEEKTFERIE